jgi:hypothetical protein
MCEAMPVFPHMPSWRQQGQLNLFICLTDRGEWSDSSLVALPQYPLNRTLGEGGASEPVWTLCSRGQSFASAGN